MLDVLVIGGGISGCSAAIYTAQGSLRTAVIDSGKSQIK
jgi:thioredoxin reductase (NADPH)